MRRSSSVVVACCSLVAVSGLMCVVCNAGSRCVLSVVCWSCVVCGVLFVVCGLLFVVCRALC